MNQPMTHIFSFERKARNSPVLVAWGRCGHHEPWAELVPVPGAPRGTPLKRRLYSRDWRIQMMPKHRFVSEDHSAFANCPGCQVSQRTGKSMLPSHHAQKGDRINRSINRVIR